MDKFGAWLFEHREWVGLGVASSSMPSKIFLLAGAVACSACASEAAGNHPSTVPKSEPSTSSAPVSQEPAPTAPEIGVGPMSAEEVDEARSVFRSLPPLTTLRKEHHTELIRKGEDAGAAEIPPEDSAFKAITYKAPSGELVAYLTKAPDNESKLPAIIWLTGGDTNSIGDVWSPSPSDNDQSATAYREAGLAMLFPSQRGGNRNPGRREGFLGEVDDVLAAREFLLSVPYVDPEHIYLGGHSSGGTLALLVAASDVKFRGVFAFGPVEHIGSYGGDLVYCDPDSETEMILRSPIPWLKDITSPTFVFEGSEGNIDSLRVLRQVNENANLHFYELDGRDHFEILDPVNRLIASKLNPEASLPLSLTQAEVRAVFNQD